MKILFPICRRRWLLINLLLGLFLAACGDSTVEPKGAEGGSEKAAKNVIFMIGDGMGLAQVSAAIMASDEALNLERAEFVGLSKTASSKQEITDSAAGATAFAIGKKTFNGAVGVDHDGDVKRTIMEDLSKRGYATGLIATSAITHATPASFYAHVQKRSQAYDIADDLARSSVNLFIGGGKNHFDKRNDSKRGKPDDRDLIALMKKRDVQILESVKQLKGKSGRAGIFWANEQPEPAVKRGDVLPTSIEPAIDFLARSSEKGFFLVVEGSQIDWGGHRKDLAYVISELLDFDAAVGQALAFAEKDKNTLVVITADHETGGLTLPSPDDELVTDVFSRKKRGDGYRKAIATFSSDGHTATMVPVYAFGKGAREFAGVYENTEIHNRLYSAMGYRNKN